MLPSGNEDEAHMPGRQALIEHAVVPCPRCGRPYVRVPSRGACPVCRQQDDMIRSLFGMRLAERPLSENETI